MDYILQLRKYIGHHPKFMVGVAVEPGEIVETAASREVHEEAELVNERKTAFDLNPLMLERFPYQ